MASLLSRSRRCGIHLFTWPTPDPTPPEPSRESLPRALRTVLVQTLCLLKLFPRLFRPCPRGKPEALGIKPTAHFLQDFLCGRLIVLTMKNTINRLDRGLNGRGRLTPRERP